VLRADIAGQQRLTLVQQNGRMRLGFNEATLIAAPATAADGMPVDGEAAPDGDPTA
jgi:hypothetical protein